MKKLLSILLILLTLSACSRKDYYVFSFDEHSIAVGFDTVKEVNVIFDSNIDSSLKANEVKEDIQYYYWGSNIFKVDVTNYKDKDISTDEGVISKFVYYLNDYDFNELKIDDVVLTKTIKQDCENLKGEYIERNGSACLLVKDVGDKKDVVLLESDIYDLSDDKLARVEIYVK